jgi:hypothetical protein
MGRKLQAAGRLARDAAVTAAHLSPAAHVARIATAGLSRQLGPDSGATGRYAQLGAAAHRANAAMKSGAIASINRTFGTSSVASKVAKAAVGFRAGKKKRDAHGRFA